MLALLSPSKTLDFEPVTLPVVPSQPEFLEETQELVDRMREIRPSGLKKLMGISDKLATLNAERYRAFSFPFTADNAKPALFAFKGDVYEPLTLANYSEEDIRYADAHLRILSGLYGLLRPLDLIQPYRLEMGIPLKNARGRDLYAFWGLKITQAINAALKPHPEPIVINLASQEYFRAVQPERLEGTLLNIVFLDQKGTAEPKIVGLYAKQARGMMADFIVRHRIESIEGLKAFNAQNYRFNPARSDEGALVFLRRH